MADIREQQIQLVLHAIEALGHDLAAAGRPHDAREKEVARFAQIHPLRLTARGRHNADAHFGIGIAGFGITLRLEQAVRVEQRHLGKDGFARDIELEVSDRTAVGRPPVRGIEIEFLGIDPVRLAVEQSIGTVGGEAGDDLRGDLDGIEVRARGGRKRSGYRAKVSDRARLRRSGSRDRNGPYRCRR